MPRALAALAVIAAAGLVLLTRTAQDDLPSMGTDLRPAPAAVETTASRGAAIPAATAETPAGAKLRELEAMSETFRNTTLLIAIRDAGFVCNELLHVYGGDSADILGWIVNCSEMLAYSVSIANGGALHVEPTLHYFDSLVPGVAPRDGGNIPSPAPPEFAPLPGR